MPIHWDAHAGGAPDWSRLPNARQYTRRVWLEGSVPAEQASAGSSWWAIEQQLGMPVKPWVLLLGAILDPTGDVCCQTQHRYEGGFRCVDCEQWVDVRSVRGADRPAYLRARKEAQLARSVTEGY